MAKTTKIQWADATWNPFIGCSKVSPACDNCYAEGWAKRAGRDFSKVVRSATASFHAPLVWKEPKRIFVCSLSDFFHADILRADRHAAIHVMRHAPQHSYMLLTKRPENIKPMLACTVWAEKLPDNVWVGVTVENQEQADRRIPLLLQVPAKMRFVSCEPLLGPVDLGHWLNADVYRFGKPNSLVTIDSASSLIGAVRSLQWVICGGESGGQARPMHPAWARSLRDQCAAAGVPFMFKQWGQFLSYKHDLTPELAADLGAFKKDGIWFSRCSKELAGRNLDGREHLQVPA